MEIVLVIILIVLVVALFVVSYMKKKRYNAELGQMREELHTGDRVMTDTGVVGEVVDSYVEDEYKYFVLKTGKDSHVGYFTVHANAIYYVFGKEDEASTQETKTKKVKVAVKTDATASTIANKTAENSDDKAIEKASKSADEKVLENENLKKIAEDKELEKSNETKTNSTKSQTANSKSNKKN